MRPGWKEHDRQFYQRGVEGKRTNQQHELRSGRFPARNSGIARTKAFQHATPTVHAKRSHRGVTPCPCRTRFDTHPKWRGRQQGRRRQPALGRCDGLKVKERRRDEAARVIRRGIVGDEVRRIWQFRRGHVLTIQEWIEEGGAGVMRGWVRSVRVGLQSCRCDIDGHPCVENLSFERR